MTSTEVRALTYAQAVNEGFHQEFERDPNVIIMGEDVAGGAGRDEFEDAWGGVFKLTTGLIGNIGQTNYAAAKMGIVGLSRVIAMENERKNVRSNILSPSAWTRMIGTIPIKDEATAKRMELTKARMRPNQIAPLGVALVADDAKDLTGQIFSIRGNEVYIWNQPRPIRGIANTEGWTPSNMLSNAFPAFRANLTDLGNARTVFTSDPL